MILKISFAAFENLPSYMQHVEFLLLKRPSIILQLEKVGYWIIQCSFHSVDDCGLTELDKVWIIAKTMLYKGFFERIICETPNKPLTKRTKLCRVKCYVPDSSDLKQIFSSADEIRRNVYYPHPIYFISCNKKSEWCNYKHLSEGEIFRQYFYSETLYSDWCSVFRED